MPNIRSQRVDRNGIEIVASDGRKFSVTLAQILSAFQTQTGTAASKKTKTLAWLQAQIEAALGPEQVSAAQIVTDFLSADGKTAIVTPTLDMNVRLEVVG